MKPVYVNFINNNILYRVGEALSKIKAIRVANEKLLCDVGNIKTIKKRLHPDGHDIYVVYLKLQESDRVDFSRMTVEQYLHLTPQELLVETIRYANETC